MGYDFQSTWKQALATKTSFLGLSPSFLLNMGYDQIKALIKQHIIDKKHQLDLARTPDFIASGSNRHSASPVIYLAYLEESRAFILA